MLSIVLVALSSTYSRYRDNFFGRKMLMPNPASKALLSRGSLVVVVIAPTALLEILGSAILIWVVLISVLATDVMFLVHMASILLGLVVSTLAVIGVHTWCGVSISASPYWSSMAMHTLGLGELVNFTPNEASEQLFGKGVVDDIAY